MWQSKASKSFLLFARNPRWTIHTLSIQVSLEKFHLKAQELFCPIECVRLNLPYGRKQQQQQTIVYAAVIRQVHIRVFAILIVTCLFQVYRYRGNILKFSWYCYSTAQIAFECQRRLPTASGFLMETKRLFGDTFLGPTLYRFSAAHSRKQDIICFCVHVFQTHLFLS